ncbi:MAG: OmpA family protein, partial [Gammaproteobacteria bacterium]|nr:OmpA family protein [Gammaproteobacteria bacterium]
MKSFFAILVFLACVASSPANAQQADDDYVDIPGDLGRGLELLEVAERAHGNSADYYELAHGHSRHSEHDHGSDAGQELVHLHVETETAADPEAERKYEEHLSAYDAVGEIFLNSPDIGNADPASRDIVKVVTAVVDAWNECSDTFGAVKRGVELMPDRAAEIAATIAIKKDCNCLAGGIWPQQRVEERIRVEIRHALVDVPRACSCSQAAMYGAVAGLPENTEFMAEAEENEAGRASITARMVEKSNEIIARTNAAQSRNDWDCGCTDVNLAATMRGIHDEDLREGTWEGLGRKYADEAGDAGLVVDAFGTVGRHPVSAWGSADINSDQHTLRRKPTVYRGDPLLLDPFDPSAEWVSHTDNDAVGLLDHQYDNDPIPTDVFLSEYIEGWNSEALAKPAEERDPDERNRVLELYNGSDKDIDLGSDQYFLEIYGAGTIPVAAPPAMVKKNTISLESGVTFELDKWEVRPEAAETLQSIADTINQADIFSELLIVGHTCDIASDEYNQLLSERRAQSVREYLEGIGLDVSAIRIEGHGEREPRLPNTSEANRSQNRRIEISFVTRGDREIQKVVKEADGRRYHEFSWVDADGAATAAAVAIPLVLGDDQYVEGDDSPREVIGLNGQVEAGGTFVIAYDESDEEITEIADVVTGQLNFLPTDTLVLRRFGGSRALSCNAHTYAFLFNYPPYILTTPKT